MACTSFTDCISGTTATTAMTNFGTIKNLSYYTINFVFYTLYAFLIVYTVYNFAFAVYKLVIGNDEETYKTVKDAFFKAVLAGLGIVFLMGARFIISQALSITGIPDSQNPFRMADPIT